MLVLSRSKNEKIIINGDIIITVANIRGNKVSLGIEAPMKYTIIRSELLEKQPTSVTKLA